MLEIDDRPWIRHVYRVILPYHRSRRGKIRKDGELRVLTIEVEESDLVRTIQFEFLSDEQCMDLFFVGKLTCEDACPAKNELGGRARTWRLSSFSLASTVRNDAPSKCNPRGRRFEWRSDSHLAGSNGTHLVHVGTSFTSTRRRGSRSISRERTSRSGSARHVPTDSISSHEPKTSPFAAGWDRHGQDRQLRHCIGISLRHREGRRPRIGAVRTIRIRSFLAFRRRSSHASAPIPRPRLRLVSSRIYRHDSDPESRMCPDLFRLECPPFHESASLDFRSRIRARESRPDRVLEEHSKHRRVQDPVRNKTRGKTKSALQREWLTPSIRLPRLFGSDPSGAIRSDRFIEKPSFHHGVERRRWTKR